MTPEDRPGAGEETPEIVGMRADLEESRQETDPGGPLEARLRALLERERSLRETQDATVAQREAERERLMETMHRLEALLADYQDERARSAKLRDEVPMQRLHPGLRSPRAIFQRLAVAASITFVLTFAAGLLLAAASADWGWYYAVAGVIGAAGLMQALAPGAGVAAPVLRRRNDGEIRPA